MVSRSVDKLINHQLNDWAYGTFAGMYDTHLLFMVVKQKEVLLIVVANWQNCDMRWIYTTDP